jgi:hypothetical protein
MNPLLWDEKEQTLFQVFGLNNPRVCYSRGSELTSLAGYR